MITLYCTLDNILLQNKLSNNNAAYYDPGFYNLIKSFLQFLQLYINGMFWHKTMYVVYFLLNKTKIKLYIQA